MFEFAASFLAKIISKITNGYIDKLLFSDPSLQKKLIRLHDVFSSIIDVSREIIEDIDSNEFAEYFPDVMSFSSSTLIVDNVNHLKGLYRRFSRLYRDISKILKIYNDDLSITLVASIVGKETWIRTVDIFVSLAPEITAMKANKSVFIQERATLPDIKTIEQMYIDSDKSQYPIDTFKLGNEIGKYMREGLNDKQFYRQEYLHEAPNNISQWEDIKMTGVNNLQYLTKARDELGKFIRENFEIGKL